MKLESPPHAPMRARISAMATIPPTRIPPACFVKRLNRRLVLLRNRKYARKPMRENAKKIAGNQVIAAIPSSMPERTNREADSLIMPLTKKIVPKRIGMSKTVNSRGVVVVKGSGYNVKRANASIGLIDDALRWRSILKNQ